MKLTVKDAETLSLLPVTLPSNNARVSDLRERISIDYGVPVSSQLLFYKHAVLLPNELLKSYRIKKKRSVLLYTSPNYFKSFFQKNILLVFLAGALFGVGHFATSVLIKNFFLEVIRKFRKS